MSYERILVKWNELDGILREFDLKDSSTPGLRREVQIAHILGHFVHKTKHGPDAYNPLNENERYEYLCSEVGRCVQMDRIDLTNVRTRIEKNSKIYAVFFVSGAVVRIYEIEAQSFLESAIYKIRHHLERSAKKGTPWIGKHIGWTEKEISKLKSVKVYEKDIRVGLSGTEGNSKNLAEVVSVPRRQDSTEEIILGH